MSAEHWKAVFLAGWVGLIVGCPASEPPPSVPQVPPKSSDKAELVRLDAAGWKQAVTSQDARYVLANAWATWCGPCREEFPYIQKLAREYRERGVALMFVTTDFDSDASAAVEFLKAQGADLPSYMKVGPDEAFIEAFHPEWSGALPATTIYDDEGHPVRFWAGKVSEEELRSALEALTSDA